MLQHVIFSINNITISRISSRSMDQDELVERKGLVAMEHMIGINMITTFIQHLPCVQQTSHMQYSENCPGRMICDHDYMDRENGRIWSSTSEIGPVFEPWSSLPHRHVCFSDNLKKKLEVS